MNMTFTDKVMMTIAAEKALRERRRVGWAIVLYVIIGMAAIALVVVLLNAFNVITFETWGSIFRFLNPKYTTISIPSARMVSITSVIETVRSFIHEHSIALIVMVNAIILLSVAKLMDAKKVGWVD